MIDNSAFQTFNCITCNQEIAFSELKCKNVDEMLWKQIKMSKLMPQVEWE